MKPPLGEAVCAHDGAVVIVRSKAIVERTPLATFIIHLGIYGRMASLVSSLPDMGEVGGKYG
jgi:hypothetical protein